jgi:hypothetical protein
LKNSQFSRILRLRPTFQSTFGLRRLPTFRPAFQSTSGSRLPSTFPLRVPVDFRLAPSVGLPASPSTNFRCSSDIDPPAVPLTNYRLASTINHQRCQRPTSHVHRILALRLRPQSSFRLAPTPEIFVPRLRTNVQLFLGVASSSFASGRPPTRAGHRILPLCLRADLRLAPVSHPPAFPSNRPSTRVECPSSGSAFQPTSDSHRVSRLLPGSRINPGLRRRLNPPALPAIINFRLPSDINPLAVSVDLLPAFADPRPPVVPAINFRLPSEIASSGSASV